MPLKLAGATPTIVYDAPRMRRVRPTASGVDAELARPVAVRHHHHARRARHVVGRKDRAAERGAHAEDLEVVAGDDLAHREARAAVEIERGEHRAVADDRLEHVVLRVQIEVVGIGRGAEFDRAGGVAGEDVDQARRAPTPAAA